MLVPTAQSRLLLGSWFVNHQPGWVTLGLDGASHPLHWGCNDLGGPVRRRTTLFAMTSTQP